MANSSIPSHTHFILVDFENIQPKDMDLLKNEPFKVKIFLGPNQAKIPVTLVKVLQPLGNNVEYIFLDTPGNNALDFFIVYYIGVLSTHDPTACFYVVSKDSGFDPLLRYMKGKKIFAQRFTSIADVIHCKSIFFDGKQELSTIQPAPQAAKQTPDAAKQATVAAKQTTPITPQIRQDVQSELPSVSEAQINIAIKDFIHREAAKPITQKTVVRALRAMFTDLSRQQIDVLIAELCKRGFMKLEGKRVSYIWFS